MKINIIDFDNFRIRDKWIQTIEIDSNNMLMAFFGMLAAVAPETASANCKNKLIAITKKGVKRDLSLF